MNLQPILQELLEAGPADCICHVRSFDGYYGGSHTESCKRFTAARTAATAALKSAQSPAANASSPDRGSEDGQR